jgi:pimeloyl-ACP methyl ester carboxylesterase
MRSILGFPLRTPETAEEGRCEVQYRMIHGHRRALILSGEGPPVLLIHGIGDSADTRREVIPHLAETHTVIAPDLLGHGRSDKPRADYSVAAYANAMRDLLTSLGHDRATIIGHSLGGGVAMQFAYQFPERCERLVLVSTGGVKGEVHPALRLVAAPNADLFLPLLGLAATRWLGLRLFALLEKLGTDLGRDTRHLSDVFESLPDRTARRAFVRTLRSSVDWRGQAITMLDRSYLASHLPTLLVWGGRDAVIPVAHAHAAHAAMEHSRLSVFEEAGHFPHLTDPERFVRVLTDFLQTTTPASHDTEAWRERLRRGRALDAAAALPSSDARSIDSTVPGAALMTPAPGH